MKKTGYGQTDRRTDRQTDRPSDRPTDTPSYRGAWTHLKRRGWAPLDTNKKRRREKIGDRFSNAMLSAPWRLGRGQWGYQIHVNVMVGNDWHQVNLNIVPHCHTYITRGAVPQIQWRSFGNILGRTGEFCSGAYRSNNSPTTMSVRW